MKFLLLLIILTISTHVVADKLNAENIYINSEELIITSNPSVSEFIGMAHARNGENQFWGDKILVYFNDSNEIELISIIDNVKIRNNEEEITGDFAEYTLKLEEIKVTGNVVLIKDNSILTGDELIVDLLNSTSIIKSSNNNQVSAKIIK